MSTIASPALAVSAPSLTAGTEWVVEALGCRPDSLRDRSVLVALFDQMIEELDLHPVEPAVWHCFPDPGGITGACVLGESHLTVHTFPEHGSLCLNLFCCRPRAAWPFDARLRTLFGATTVHVRHLVRAYGPHAD